MTKRYWDIRYRVKYVSFYTYDGVEVDEILRTSTPLETELQAITYGISHQIKRLRHDNLIDYMYIVNVTPFEQVAHITLGENMKDKNANKAPTDYEFFDGPTIETSVKPRRETLVHSKEDT